MELGEAAVRSLANTGQMLALVDALHDGTLNESQRKTVHELCSAILTLAEHTDPTTDNAARTECQDSFDKL
jgi:hypothetical protein